MKLWLDDIRDPREHGAFGFTWAKDYEEAVALLRTRQVTFASLDHDLSPMASIGQPAPGEKSGHDVIVVMQNEDLWPKNGVAVHSQNPDGKIRMRVAVLNYYGRLFTLGDADVEFQRRERR